MVFLLLLGQLSDNLIFKQINNRKQKQKWNDENTIL